MSEQTPTIGRIVIFTANESVADAINKRRADAAGAMDTHRHIADGSQIHVGNRVEPGMQFPMLIVRVWDSPTGLVQGQVFLDGNDTYWATSVKEGEGGFTWSWPPRV